MAEIPHDLKASRRIKRRTRKPSWFSRKVKSLSSKLFETPSVTIRVIESSLPGRTDNIKYLLVLNKSTKKIRTLALGDVVAEIPRVISPGPDLKMPGDVLETFDSAANKLGQPRIEAIRRAAKLLSIAVEAEAEGHHMAIIDDSDVIVQDVYAENRSKATTPKIAEEPAGAK